MASNNETLQQLLKLKGANYANCYSQYNIDHLQ